MAMHKILNSFKSPWGGDDGEGSGSSGDEAMKKAQENIRKLFGDENKKGGSGGNSGGPSKSILENYKLIFLIAFGFWLSTGIYSVDDKQGEQAAILRFGKFNRVEDAGLHFHLPYPIESHIIKRVKKARTINIGLSNVETIRRSKRHQAVYDSQAYMLTRDFNILNVSMSVLWSIKDLNHYLFSAKDPESTMGMIAESVLRAVIAKNDMDTAFTRGKLSIQQEVHEELQRIVDDYKLGIIVRQVELQGVEEPLQVRDAFRDVESARQDKETTINQANAYRDSLIPEARGKVQRILKQAQAYHDSTIARATGDAARFESILAEYKKAPLVTKKRMYIEAMEEILAGAKKVMITKKGGVMPYLPLDRLMGKKHKKNKTKDVMDF